eukprot:3975285-Lingulodinium_polyedra.AAC.1
MGKHKPYIEIARTGSIRSTLRVLIPGDSTKRLWAEVRENVCSEHEQIIRKVYDAVLAGHVCSKEEASEMADALVQNALA